MRKLASAKYMLENLHLDARGLAFPLWGIFEVFASSAGWVLLQIARRQDTKPLFHELPGSDEALFPELQGDNCWWQAKTFLSVTWEDVFIEGGIGCCYYTTKVTCWFHF